MPAPALLGIPALVAAISALFTSLIAWFVNVITKRFVYYTILVTALWSLMMNLYDAFQILLTEVVVELPPEFSAAAVFLPSNTITCISIVVSGEILALTYKTGVYLINVKMSAVK
ncbi:DUF5455 family protein [Shewanella algae]|uniref:DUF5455 family protein n=1 Tax=Shewanella algae TaxID=38313 RepID=UPI003005A3D9